MSTKASAQTLPRRRPGIYRLLVQVTVFISAFTIFLIEPMVTKVLLPFFGGSASVWATCLVFFQVALLLGYYYADVTTRFLSPKRQVQIQILLLAGSIVFLPFTPGVLSIDRSVGHPAFRIITLLTSTIGLPFLLMSSTSPLAQSWSKRLLPDKDPYRLFALSNLASLAGLLGYPFLIEPQLSSTSQLRLCSALFAVFILLCSGIAIPSLTERQAEARILQGSKNFSEMPSQKLRWVALSAGATMLLLSITNHLTQNIAPVPLLWVLPLSAYLLSFTIAFSGTRSCGGRFIPIATAISVCVMAYLVLDPGAIMAVQFSVPLFCIGLFVSCLFCHCELQLRKPKLARLPSFYLMIALGGAAGALFVGILAPLLFRSLYEFPLTLLLVALLGLATQWSQRILPRSLWSLVAAATACVLLMKLQSLNRDSITMVRNFYGALRVTESVHSPYGSTRTLYHGVVRHGAQFRRLPWRKMPLTYYSVDSGIGLTLENCCQGPRRVGVVGLGTGTLAAYGRKGDVFHFYEINPAVVKIATSLFSFLDDSPAEKVITVGDGRLSLEREAPQRFDVIAIDAFSGDAIPVHLLTKEAIALYLRHLKPNGVLAIHTTNMFLQLDAVAKQLAQTFGYPAKLIENKDREDLSITSSHWVLISRDLEFMNLPALTIQEWPIDSLSGLKPWTDDRNNLFEVLNPPSLFSNRAE